MTEFYLGLDPGVSGGIAVIRSDGTVVDVFKMPETPRDVLEVLAAVDSPRRAILEKVAAFAPPGMSL